MKRMTSNRAIEIIMSKGYASTVPYISYEDARSIMAEYPNNVGMFWDNSKADNDPNYKGEIYFYNKSRSVMHYYVKKEVQRYDRKKTERL